MANSLILKLNFFVNESTMNRFGLPMIISGSRPVEAFTKAIIEPISGIKPFSVGQLKSGCVAI
jgi:hypothetical protein